MSTPTPETLGLQLTDPAHTYLDDYERVWIGARWDIAEDKHGDFHVYRKGNWVLKVHSFELALAIVADAEGTETP